MRSQRVRPGEQSPTRQSLSPTRITTINVATTVSPVWAAAVQLVFLAAGVVQLVLLLEYQPFRTQHSHSATAHLLDVGMNCLNTT